MVYLTGHNGLCQDDRITGGYQSLNTTYQASTCFDLTLQ